MPIILELFASFFQVGLGAYGGGTVTIPLILHEIVIRHEWLTKGQFSDLIALSQMTPGPIAINAATLVGFKIAGLAGSIAATAGVVMPSVLIAAVVLACIDKVKQSRRFVRFQNALRPGVLALIILACITISEVSVTDLKTSLIAAVAFLLFSLLKNRFNPVFIIIIAGFAGLFFLQK